MARPSKARIRPFGTPDLAVVRQLIHNTIDTCYSGVYPPRAVAFFKDFHSEADRGTDLRGGYWS